MGRLRLSRRARRALGVAALVVAGAGSALVAWRTIDPVLAELDWLAYLALFAACWVGAGGLLVPVPGVRPASWLMIVHQGAILHPVPVAVVASIAMTLGQSTYFLAGRGARAVGTAGERLPDLAASAIPAADGPGAGTEPAPAGATDPAPAGTTDPAPAGTTDPAPAPVSRRARIASAARARVETQLRHHPVRTIWLTTVFPSPVTTLATTTAAALGTPYLRWLVSALAGYTTFSFVLVLAGQGIVAFVRSLAPG